ncbi:unnamed protein product [Calicophoron daubneyi]|uniref:Phosphatidylinositol 3-kinase n=1 Tax=Calicophoron daubneyi TaxID=300641 RepID=A0AAV2TZE0_CALDB
MPTAPALKRGFSLILESTVRLEFLLPNGLLIPLVLDSDLSLLEAKDELWSQASHEPLFDVLHSKDHYVFSGINRETADEEEYYDQTIRLRELPLLLPYLRVIEATRDSALLQLHTRNATIASCIGISHADIVRAGRLNPEVKWARQRLLKLATVHANALAETGPVGLASYLTAAPRRALTKSLKATLQDCSSLVINAWMLDGSNPPEEKCIKVTLSLQATVLDALNELLHRQLMLFEQTQQVQRGEGNMRKDTIPRVADASGYLLKICCSQAYLFETNEKLIAYEYVQRCVELNQYPCLSPVLLKTVCDSLVRSLTDSVWGGRLNSMVPMDYNKPARPPRSPRISPTSRLMTGDRPARTRSAEKLTASKLSLPFENNVPLQNSKSSALYDELERLMGVGEFSEGNDELLDIEEDGDVRYSSASDTEPLNNVDANTYCSQPPSKKRPIVSLWKVTGYLSVLVRCGQYLGGSLSPATVQSPDSPSPQRLNSALTGSTGSLTPASSVASVTQSFYVVRVGLFHGSQSLIEFKTTSEMPGVHLSWNKWLNFHVNLADIPPAARLCVALIQMERSADKRSQKTYEYPVGWANLNFFDQRGFMITDEITLRLWPASLLQFTEERFNRLYPAGTVLENPNPDFTLQIRIYNPVSAPIRRPSFRAFIDAHRDTSKYLSSFPPPTQNQRIQYGTVLGRTHMPNMGFVNQVFGSGEVEEDVDECVTEQNVLPPDLTFGSRLFGEQGRGLPDANEVDKDLAHSLQILVTRDPLYELSEQEKASLWRGRNFCLKHLPAALPWLTQAVCWYRHEYLIEFYHLLHSWTRELNVDVALQLLGAMGLNTSGATETSAMLDSTAAASGTRGGASGVADAYVRELAVSSLYKLSDVELSDYLLQLVQALKAEAYLDNALTRFILYRAMKNPLLIGLRFFWHLRSEIHIPEMRLRFGLLLEAFCVGCGPMLTFLARQVTALNRLETISERVKQLSSEEEQRAQFRKEVAQAEARRDLQWLPSPLCLSERLGKLLIEKCDVKRSKKRPLWLVWTNSDRLAAHHHQHYQLIFKHGDDLRQDMLTLNLLRVMDRIWKEEGMDMCLVPYGCLATGPEMGLIEVVRNARTVMSIQGERLKAALQIDSTQLYKWLMQHIKGSEDSTKYERTIRNFTLSCAGYCVATFVLGIRDRHPDNIMVDTSGRLFHIDFGHILDNRKKKFGITRERVPFVLTKDFITVIARGNPDVVLDPSGSAAVGTTGLGNVHFQEFTELCGRAYLLLRRHANLLLTLFAMMLPSGLPELTSVCDLDYVRKTLAVEMNDEQALAYFHGQLNEAYYGAWTTKIDWFSHWMNT